MKTQMQTKRQTRVMARAAALLLGLVACHKASPEPPPPVLQVPVQVRAVQEDAVAPRFASRAEVFTLDDALVVAQQAGRVKRVDFAPGSRVRAGQVLVELETDALQIELARAQTQVALRRMAWRDSARRSARRLRARADSPDLITQEALESSASETAKHQGELQAAEQAAKAAQLALQQASIRAPCQGVVQSREVLLGQHVAVGGLLGRIAGNGPTRLRFYLPHAATKDLALGAAVEVGGEPPAGPAGREPAARVSFIAASADSATRQVEVHAVLKRGALRPGSSTAVALQLPARRALTVPRAAVFPSEAGMAVYVAHAGVAQLRPVTLLPGQGPQVQVETGLEPGEQVVVTDLERLRPGAAVAPQPAVAAEQAEP